MRRVIAGACALVLTTWLGALPALADIIFSTGNPDGKIATLSQPAAGALPETETADDFPITQTVAINQATITGLLVGEGLTTSSVNQVEIELYNVFPTDSVNPPDGKVPTRVNSPSDSEFSAFDSNAGALNFSVTTLNASFTAANSVVTGIHPLPNVFTGGEGPVTGQEVLITVTFTPPLILAPGHYFFRPEVNVTGGMFLWLSAPKPIVPPGTPFPAAITDLQSWTRNAPLDPDWLRIGTDITGQGPFNAAFSLIGTAINPLQIHTLSNLTFGDSAVNITNSGDSATGLSPVTQALNGNLCVNVYTFSPDEQLVSCCACHVTPNALWSLSALNDLISNTLTPGTPSSVTVKLVATLAGPGGASGPGSAASPTCNPATVAPAGVVGGANTLANGLAAWATTIHALGPSAVLPSGGTVPPPGTTLGVTETEFTRGTLSAAELARLNTLCGFIQGNGSGFGICKSCRFGGLGGNKQ